MSLPKSSLAIVAIVASLIGGGLAGAIFNNWVNRPKTTVISYSLSSATIADTESGSLVPGLKVQIGTEDVQNLYTHSIVLTVTKGPQIDSGDIAIDFPNNTKFYGEPSITTPSPVHKLDCSNVQSGLICRMSPVRREAKLPPFRVAVANDTKADPDLVTSTKGLELQPAQETLTAASRQTTFLETIALVFGVIASFASAVLASWTVKRNAAREAELARIEAQEQERARVEAQETQRHKLSEELIQRYYAAPVKRDKTEPRQ